MQAVHTPPLTLILPAGQAWQFAAELEPCTLDLPALQKFVQWSAAVERVFESPYLPTGQPVHWSASDVWLFGLPYFPAEHALHNEVPLAVDGA
jgi:hypothetical protein